MLTPIINKAKAEQILHDALEILSQLGIECTCEAVAKALQAKMPLQYKGNRLHFCRDALLRHFEMLKPALFPNTRPDKITMGGQWHAWYYLDPATNSPRKATYSEAILMARFAEAFGKRWGPIPVGPEGIQPRFYTMECERIALLNTKTLGCGLTATSAKEIETLIEMYAAAGRRYELALEPLISPLRLNTENMQLYFRWAEDSRVNISVFETIPMAGATAPLVFPAALAMAFAETLAQSYIFYMYSHGRHGRGLGLRLEAIDMKSMNIMFGSPENLVIRQAIAELWRELTGAAPVSGAMYSNAKRVDAQAVAERTAGLLWMALQGARRISGIGQLSVDEVFSPVMAIIDREIIKAANRLLCPGGVQWNSENNTVEVVRQGLTGGGFLQLESTADSFRGFYALDMMATYENCAAWITKGCMGIEEKAIEEIEAITAGHTFELGVENAREVNRLADGFVKSS